jgi:hypothetical protein
MTYDDYSTEDLKKALKEIQKALDNREKRREIRILEGIYDNLKDITTSEERDAINVDMYSSFAGECFCYCLSDILSALDGEIERRYKAIHENYNESED